LLQVGLKARGSQIGDACGFEPGTGGDVEPARAPSDEVCRGFRIERASWRGDDGGA
jgi:hypothetical protein